MGYVRFKGSTEVLQMQIKPIGNNMVQLYPPLPYVELTAGFELLTRPKGGKVYGNYLAYTTLYRKMKDGSVILSNDGSVYIPPEPPEYIIRFVLANGKIIGNETQVLKSFENLIVPEVEMYENYEFLGWNQEIPTEGEIKNDITYYAEVRYIPTLEIC